ncbi:MAG: hypothetical protein N2258_08530 [Brevinematales bacterium]|nr:hypothetical protein [Brevinematales bacterium]
MKKFLFALLLLCGMIYPVKKEFSYYGLRLGLTMEEAIEIIENNGILKIDESRFFGKINEPVPFILKATYKPFINQFYLQFYSNVVYGITIQFNNLYFDFFTLSERLEDVYGVPTKKSSKIVEWRTLSNFQNVAGVNSDIILRLEYPSTVKVFDNIILLKLNSEVSQKIILTTNQTFINSNRNLLLNEF